MKEKIASIFEAVFGHTPDTTNVGCNHVTVEQLRQVLASLSSDEMEQLKQVLASLSSDEETNDGDTD